MGFQRPMRHRFDAFANAERHAVWRDA